MTTTTLNNTVLDVAAIKNDFPILARTVKGKPLVYLDNAATSQKPRQVIEAVENYYRHSNSNVHRGVHTLSEEATNAFERAREKARRFINAASTSEIVFTRGTTEAINLVAQSHARPGLGPGDEILITHMEHHSNIVPWQLLREQTGATLNVVPIDHAGELDMEAFERLLTERTRIVALNHVSNALGTVNPVRDVIERAHGFGATVLLDGAQAVPHMAVDVAALNCDFYAFSGHKMFAPTGIGVLYGREQLLETMPPYQGGGDMIKRVTFAQTTFNDLPFKFEAGTPNIAGAIGLGAAMDYLTNVGLDRIAAHEHELLVFGARALAEISGLRPIGTAREKAGVLSFVLEDIHPHDVGTILDHQGIAVRTGHHCAQPVMDHFGVPATVRASLALYNSRQDLEALVDGLQKVRGVFAS